MRENLFLTKKEQEHFAHFLLNSMESGQSKICKWRKPIRFAYYNWQYLKALSFRNYFVLVHNLDVLVLTHEGCKRLEKLVKWARKVNIFRYTTCTRRKLDGNLKGLEAKYWCPHVEDLNSTRQLEIGKQWADVGVCYDYARPPGMMDIISFTIFDPTMNVSR